MQNLSKKLIEVALPLDAINAASAREKSIRHGHPSTLHLWWARRPLAAARAVIFAQLVDDPSSHPDLFPTTEAQEQERQRLFRLIEQLVLWENTTNETVLQAARDEIWRSWRRTCATLGATLGGPASLPAHLFDADKLPAFHDPFAGGGSLPLEAQRLGLESYASDLNPVAVLINKAMIEIPPKFAGRPPVNPADTPGNADIPVGKRAGKDAGAPRLFPQSWRGAQGLAADVRYYGQWMRDEAEKRIGHLYPKVAAIQEPDGSWRHATPAEIQNQKSQIKNLTVIAWLWARTVKSPNPAFAHVDVPLASTFMLSTKTGKEAWVEPVIEGDKYHFFVKTTGSAAIPGGKGVSRDTGAPRPPEAAKGGTTEGKRNAFRCLISNVPISYDYIRQEGQAGRMGVRLMAIVAEGERGRVYLPPTVEMEMIARQAQSTWQPETPLPVNPRDFKTPNYGMNTFGDLFTPRQLVALTTFSDLVQEARVQVLRDAQAWERRHPDGSRLEAGAPGADDRGLADGGVGATAYADAVAVYLAFGISRSADFWSNLCIWANQPKNELVTHLFGRQAIPMAWDYAEANPFSDSGGNFEKNLSYVAKGIDFLPAIIPGFANQIDAAANHSSFTKIVSTDPPYFDNVGYADLSDYFYVWLRRSLRLIFPDLFATLAVPKAEELVATPYRHGSKLEAEAFFLNGMTQAMERLAEQAHPAFPATIYYAFKQAETESSGTSSTGWETFLEAVIRAGFAITGTWPMHTERQGRMIGNDANALASSIILVCRSRPATAPTATRREFLSALRAELPTALTHLQRGNIAPVDLAQAAIGPGMAVYTRYAKVLDAAGRALSVREALALINQTLDEVLAEQEGDFDADSRWALAWFEQFGFNDGPFGDAETLSKAKNTAMQGLVEAGLVLSRAGRVRLLRPAELPADWNPVADSRLTVWEMVHHLIRALDTGGEGAAALLAAGLGSRAETARELAYRLYTLCERRKRAQEALAYNSLVQSWPEILRLAEEAKQGEIVAVGQASLFG
jgi:putative DNA methylase